ncbi:hypothetical protein NQ318_017496 [Aromia moschata]|uniref:Uncharacterized protein n=1 Tax=Aromia moschata TaxID=1265417 RepID=A0AAV8XPN8_9CUCU|nr:hypothetical protein NQ318_017496 [Aromia moschata]
MSPLPCPYLDPYTVAAPEINDINHLYILNLNSFIGESSIGSDTLLNPISDSPCSYYDDA